MGKKTELKGYSEIKLDFKEEIQNLVGNVRKFPKYTTQLINLANQNAQGTRPKVVGQMSDLINQCPEKSYSGWRKWYLETHPDAIENATDKIFPMIQNLKEAANKIDREMVKDWVEDLVLNKTAEGLIIQEIILAYIADMRKQTWRCATPEEESRNIDGYIGESPVQIKPKTYLTQDPIVREEIEIEIIFYAFEEIQGQRYLKIYVKDENPLSG